MSKDHALDLLELSKKIPETIKPILLKKLFITESAYGKWSKANVQTIADFIKILPIKLISGAGIGLQTISETVAECQKLEQAGSLLRYHFSIGTIPDNDQTFVEELLSRLDMEAAGLMKERYGLEEGCRAMTLAEIGQKTNVTRENVRKQIERHFGFLGRIYAEYLGNYVQSNQLRWKLSKDPYETGCGELISVIYSAK